jgi:hypothetical protein
MGSVWHTPLGSPRFRGWVITHNKVGNLFAWNWTHADGTTGSGADFNNELTQIRGSTNIYDVPSSAFQTTVNPDGSYLQQSWDPGDTSNSTTYSANGNQTSSSANVPGAGKDYRMPHTYRAFAPIRSWRNVLSWGGARAGRDSIQATMSASSQRTVLGPVWRRLGNAELLS